MRIGWILSVLLAGGVSAQDTAPESELTSATRATVQKGFAYTLKPVVSMPDGFPQDRQALAGTTIVGEYSDGVYHARDGTYEIYKKGALTLVRTERGWLPMEQYTSAMRQDVAQAFDDRDGRLWRRGNVTAGRKSLQQLIQLSHLNHRTNIDNLTRLEQSILDPKQIRGATLNGKPAALYEGEIAETAAFKILQGPFETLVERGNLAFRNVSGVTRFYLQEGVVRRIVLKVQGSYSTYEETDNTRRRGVCTLEITADLTKHGEVKVELPREAGPVLKSVK
jgi:hypothetical protein